MHSLANSFCDDGGRSRQENDCDCNDENSVSRGTQRFPTHRFIVELELGSNVRSCGCHNNCGCNNGCSNGCNTGCNNNCGCGCNNNCGCGCGCNSCTLNSDAVFTIEKSQVLVNSLVLANPSMLTPSNVTVDGICVDSLTQSGGQFTATTNNLVSQISKERCLEAGLASRGFLLISGAGPWVFRGTFVFEGTVNTGGKTCRFVAKFKTKPSEPILISGSSTFAIPKVAFPCVINGTGPIMNFNFSGSVYLLKPEINAFCIGSNCMLNLRASLAVEPKVNVEVVRKSLFCVDACEGLRPCDGTMEAFEVEEEEEENCERKPACRCGTANSVNSVNTSCSCNNNTNSAQWNGCNGCNW